MESVRGGRLLDANGVGAQLDCQQSCIVGAPSLLPYEPLYQESRPANLVESFLETVASSPVASIHREATLARPERHQHSQGDLRHGEDCDLGTIQSRTYYLHTYTP